MFRKILAVIAGLVAAIIIFIVMQAIGGAIYGRPQTGEGGAMPDPVVMAEFLKNLPVGAFIMLAVGYMIGSFVGGFVARKISRSEDLVIPIIIGVVLTLVWIMNITMLPHPVWVVIVGFFCYIPFTILGHRAAK